MRPMAGISNGRVSGIRRWSTTWSARRVGEQPGCRRPCLGRARWPPSPVRFSYRPQGAGDDVKDFLPGERFAQARHTGLCEEFSALGTQRVARDTHESAAQMRVAMCELPVEARAVELRDPEAAENQVVVAPSELFQSDDPV